MRIAREGWIFILIPLGAAALLVAAAASFEAPALRWLGGASLLLSGFCAWFFRDPRRTPPAQADLLVAPADGRVTAVGPAEEGAPGTRRVVIFLSVFDVHINRSPAAGAVREVRYRPGRFRAAFRADAGETNERNELEIATAHGTILVRQIVGVLARRIVCRSRPGDELARGERFGLIRFGSRTDALLPPGVTLLVRPGDRVRGGETPIARWP